jgi:hypothetical protein
MSPIFFRNRDQPCFDDVAWPAVRLDGWRRAWEGADPRELRRDLTKSDAARFPPTAGISLSSTESRNRNCCTDRNADAAKVDRTDQLYWQEKIRPIIGRRPCPQGH